ncbi:MAG: hypothetical protein GJ680_12485 [Alteromonadaceae bacterium]|nr:hypothetical protein [Alteromonadaceae bacterium]
MSDFIKHGDCDVHWDGNILVVNLSGLFNQEGVYEANLKVKEAVANKPAEHWARIDILATTETLAPTGLMFDGFVAHLKMLKKHGCQILAFVGGNVIARDSSKVMCEKAKLTYQSCTDLAQAKYLCNAHLTSLNEAQVD